MMDPTDTFAIDELRGLTGLTIEPIMSTRTQPLPGVSQSSGLEHFGLITDNLETAVNELKTKGARIVKEVTQLRPELRIAFLLAPENVLIELMEITG